jgi:hypothetical protein
MTSSPRTQLARRSHDWLRQIEVTFVPGPMDPLLEEFTTRLMDRFEKRGHRVQPKPQDGLDVLITTATFGEPLHWKETLTLTARRKFSLEKAPVVYHVLHASRRQFTDSLAHFERALAKQPPDPTDFDFPGLSPNAFRTLYEQGRRGGPILSLQRLVQSQAKGIRILLVVGDEQPEEAYTFDLVGAYPRSLASDPGFYDDLALRIVTAASTHEITHHRVAPDPVPRAVWESLSTPRAMRQAGHELGERQFFTEMIQISNLVYVPSLDNVISSQYSEGCFATWDPQLDALVATITGSARPVEKDHLTDDELAVITASRPDGLGAEVRHVEGLRNDPPSSEAVELIDMDTPLPRIRLTEDEWGSDAEVPVARSKLHGHRGVRAYDPSLVEHVHLDPPYYHYPVSCSTDAQARAIRAAFSRAEALNNPADPRQVVFTVIPGHGIVIAEKWVPGKEPLQVIWEFMDAGALEIDNLVPQGVLEYEEEDGKMVLRAEESGSWGPPGSRSPG